MLREMEIWVKCKSFRALWSVVQMWQHTSSDFPMGEGGTGWSAIY